MPLQPDSHPAYACTLFAVPVPFAKEPSTITPPNSNATHKGEIWIKIWRFNDLPDGYCVYLYAKNASSSGATNSRWSGTLQNAGRVKFRDGIPDSDIDEDITMSEVYALLTDPPAPSRSSSSMLSTGDSCTLCQGGSSVSGTTEIASDKYLKRFVLHLYGTHTFEYDGWTQTTTTHSTWKIPGRGQITSASSLVALFRNEISRLA